MIPANTAGLDPAEIQAVRAAHPDKNKVADVLVMFAETTRDTGQPGTIRSGLLLNSK
jgi:hypothetical protein